MRHLTYERITSENDPGIPFLMQMYQQPEIAQYLSVGDKYFHYIANTADVYFYKVLQQHRLVGTLHLEKQGNLLSLAILIFPECQRKGLGTSILRDVQDDFFGLSCDRIEVAVDESNAASLKLFERAGFTFVSKEDELLYLAYPRQ